MQHTSVASPSLRTTIPGTTPESQTQLGPFGAVAVFAKLLSKLSVSSKLHGKSHAPAFCHIFDGHKLDTP
jgi:hypothetical protein